MMDKNESMQVKDEAINRRLKKEHEDNLRYCSYHTKHLIPVSQCYLKFKAEDGSFWYERAIGLAVIEMRDERKKGTNEYTMEWVRYLSKIDSLDFYDHNERMACDIIYSEDNLELLNKIA